MALPSIFLFIPPPSLAPQELPILFSLCYTFCTGPARAEYKRKELSTMKLNPDCIRDILISAESVVTFNDHFYYDRENPLTSLQDYSHEEIIYHIRQAHDAGLISISPFLILEALSISPT